MFGQRPWFTDSLHPPEASAKGWWLSMCVLHSFLQLLPGSKQRKDFCIADCTQAKIVAMCCKADCLHAAKLVSRPSPSPGWQEYQQQQHQHKQLQACSTTRLRHAMLAAVAAPIPLVLPPQLWPALHLTCAHTYRHLAYSAAVQACGSLTKDGHVAASLATFDKLLAVVARVSLCFRHSVKSTPS